MPDTPDSATPTPSPELAPGQTLPPIPKEILAKLPPDLVNTSVSVGAYIFGNLGPDAATDLLLDLLRMVAVAEKGLARRFCDHEGQTLWLLAANVNPTPAKVKELLEILEKQHQEQLAAKEAEKARN